MQTVIHEYTNLSPIFTDIEVIYAEVSTSYNSGLRLLPLSFDTSFIDLYEILRDNVSWCPQYVFEEKAITHINVPESNNMIVCISGGKDSVALTNYYINNGYNVYLYHMHGINKVYPDEVEAVKNVAKYFQVPLYIENIVLSGKQDFVEHPMKNYIIANGAIHYAIREHLGINIAFGNFNESYLEDNDFDVCAGDCMDMWYAYEKIVRRYLPEFTMNIPFRTNADTIEILKDKPGLLRLCVSCMSPYRFREYWKKRTEKKYNIQLLPHRCGCCWKCCLEALYFTYTGLLDYPVEYLRHCIQILSKTYYKEQKVKPSFEELWSYYIFYPMEDFKYYNDIKDTPIVC